MTAVHDPSADLALTVAAKTLLSADVLGITLAGPPGDPLPGWAAGAHIDVQCGDHRRQYSLCGDPDDILRYQIAVLRQSDSRGGSTYLHDVLSVNDVVRVSKPRNAFSLVPAERYVFIAGGIGITPMLPMIREAESKGSDWVLHYGGRTRATMAFLGDLRKHSDRNRIYPRDEVGRIPIAEILEHPTPDTKIYACGPTPLLESVRNAAHRWPDGSLHVERFVAVELDATNEHAFEVRLAGSGRTYHVPPNRTILEVLAAAGVDVASSCEVGTCGTCEVTVLEGIPEHRDSVLTDEDRRQGCYMMPCVSRCAAGPLVLDM